MGKADGWLFMLVPFALLIVKRSVYEKDKCYENITHSFEIL